jgi:hypothetical protein
MFPLHTDAFPATGADLARFLNGSLRDLFALTYDPVRLEEKSYPLLDSLIVCLDGAQLQGRSPAMPVRTTTPQPALTIDSFKVSGAPVSVGPASVDFNLMATHVELHRATDRDGHILLLLHNAENGRIEISVIVSELEALIAEVAQSEAGKHGVNIDSVQLALRSLSSRSLAAEVQLHAKKLFLGASLCITGQLDLDEQMNAKISGLDCRGEGTIANIACGVLKPHLQKLDGRVFSLLSLPLGEVRLCDVRITVDAKLSVTAEFGSAREYVV